jgi:hypothetical protein
VLLAKRADYTTPSRNTFEKSSLVGAYGQKVYRIEERAGKSNSKLFIVPVYRLSGLTSWYYESEIKPALFVERRRKFRRRRTERLKLASEKRRLKKKQKKKKKGLDDTDKSGPAT